MISIPAFAVQGVADFSNIKAELQALQSTIAGLRVPAIKTQVEAPNMGPVQSAVANASKEVVKIRTEVDTSSIKSGLSQAMSQGKGNFAAVGQDMAQSIQMGMQQKFGMMGGAVSSLAMAMGPVGIAATAGAVALGALGVASVNAAKNWESLTTRVGRTTGLAEQPKELEKLMNSLQDLRMEMGVSADAAAGMVEQAGSIGVGQQKMAAGDIAGYRKEITDFTRSTAMLQGAWGMSAEATAQGIGKMGSVTLGAWNQQRKAAGEAEMTWSEYAEGVGGKVDSLANTMGSSEEEIVTAMRNASSAVASFAPSEETYSKWLSLSSFLIDTGASAGEAGTQIERLAKGAKQHGAALGSIIGVDNVGFQEKLKTDFVGTFQEIATSLAAMPESERPDMIKLLGIEGAGAMDKMIADVKSGVNKLNTAIELDPSNITEGWDKVADDANIAFSRIGQAFQVALEKMGGAALPIVTDIANGIADAMTTGINAGSSAWNTVKSRVANADQAIAETGSLTEWGKSLLGWDDESHQIEKTEKAVSDLDSTKSKYIATAHKVTQAEFEQSKAMGAALGSTYGDVLQKTSTYALAGTAAGTAYHDALGKALKQGMPNAAENAAIGNYLGDLNKDAAAAGKAVGEEFTEAKKLAMLAAMPNEAVLKGSESFSLFGDQYEIKKLKETVSGEKDKKTTEIFGPNQKLIGTLKSWGDATEIVSEAHYKHMKDSIMDVGAFMKTRYSQISEDLGSIMTDGLLGDAEKQQLELYDNLLSLYKQDIPVEFKAANLDELQKKVKDAIKGPWNVETALDPRTAAANFALWRSQEEALIMKIYEGSGQTIMPTEEVWKPAQVWSKDASEEQLAMWQAAKGALVSDDYGDVFDFIKELERLAPELENAQWLTQFKTVAQMAERSYAPEKYYAGSVAGEQRLQSAEFMQFGGGSDTIRKRSPTLALEQGIFENANKGFGSVAKATKDSTAPISGLGEASKTSTSKMDAAGNTVEQTSSGLSAALQTVNTGLSTLNARVWQLAESFSGAAEAIASAASNAVGAMNSIAGAAASSQISIRSGSNAGGYGFQPAQASNLGMFSGWLTSRNLVPKLATGGVVPAGKGGLAFIGEAGETEYVIPESQLKGLYPEFAAAAKGTMKYLLSDRLFEDYLPPNITPAKGYMWGKYPAMAPVNQYNIQNRQTSWLSEDQENAGDYYSGEFRKQQISAMNQSIMPWFARGPQAQPKWWSDAATKLSPGYKDNWNAAKGGMLTGGLSGLVASAQNLKLNENIALIQDPRSDACIAFVKPSGSLRTTDAFYLANGAANIDTDRSLLYDERTDSCIPMLKAPYLKTNDPFYLNTGSQPTGGASKTLQNIEKNTDVLHTLAATTDKMVGVFDLAGAFGARKSISVGEGGNPLIVGKSTSGYVVTYDPRSDTCEGLPFNPPDPSLKTSDPFYLGISSGSLVNEDYENGVGWGGRMAQVDPNAPNSAYLQEQQSVMKAQYAESQRTEKNTASMDKGIKEMNKITLPAMANAMQGALVVGGGGYGGGGGAWGSHGGSGGSYGSFFGGWLSGGAAGVGVSMPGEAQPSWMPSWTNQAEGGIVDGATPIIFGEAGREAFVPISDRAAGLRILPQVMKELGVRQFASGGIVGSGGSNGTLGGISIDARLIVSGSSKAEIMPILAAHKRQILSELPKRLYEATKR